MKKTFLQLPTHSFRISRNRKTGQVPISDWYFLGTGNLISFLPYWRQRLKVEDRVRILARLLGEIDVIDGHVAEITLSERGLEDEFEFPAKIRCTQLRPPPPVPVITLL